MSDEDTTRGEVEAGLRSPDEFDEEPEVPVPPKGFEFVDGDRPPSYRYNADAELAAKMLTTEMNRWAKMPRGVGEASIMAALAQLGWKGETTTRTIRGEGRRVFARAKAPLA